MAEPLKNHFGPAIPRNIAAMITAVHPRFRADTFLKEALQGYQTLALLPRGWHIARTLRRYLPADYPQAVEILIASLGPKLAQTDSLGMAPFLYLPHVLLIAEHGLGHFEPSMRAQYELTQRFTAEFSIRPFLAHHPAPTLARLKLWTGDPSAHVRRLVSEGTRSRLPWAPRLRAFQEDPRPVLALLESLKDDPALYVRRSVANNLNDIGKDHPDLLAATARRWMNNASEERRWLVRHGLRSAVKRGETAALDILGFSGTARATIDSVAITPRRARIGDRLAIAFDLTNTGPRRQALLVDFRIHFVKANGKSSAKVFKLKTVELAPRATVRLSKNVSLREMTTRKHYSGRHQVDVVLNGQVQPLGSFELMKT
ncbi:MAG: DNA alkylation repair protein [Pseudomonadota bacterium]